MKTMEYIRWADPPLWTATLAGLLPLWLISLVFIAPDLGSISFWLAIVAIIVLRWLRWFTAELILYSFLPIIVAMSFEEVPASYKAPFVLLCTLMLTIGIVGYQISLHKGSMGSAWLILLLTVIGTWLLASRLNENYWEMVRAIPWWTLLSSS